MAGLSKFDKAALGLVRQNGGTLTVDIQDRTKRDLLFRLEKLAEAGHLEEVQSDVSSVTYRLPASKATQ